MVPVFLPAVIVIALLVIGTLSAPELAGNLFSATLSGNHRTLRMVLHAGRRIILDFYSRCSIVTLGTHQIGSSIIASPNTASPLGSPCYFPQVTVLHYCSLRRRACIALRRTARWGRRDGRCRQTSDANRLFPLGLSYLGYLRSRRLGFGILLLSAWLTAIHAINLIPSNCDKIHGPAGHTIDTFAILSTLFGIATTLGLSVIQINTGLNYLWETSPLIPRYK